MEHNRLSRGGLVANSGHRNYPSKTLIYVSAFTSTQVRPVATSLKRRGSHDLEFNFRNKVIYFDLKLAVEDADAAKEVADLHEAFMYIDTKHDGHLDADEVWECFQRLNHRCSNAYAKAIIWDLDDDGDLISSILNSESILKLPYFTHSRRWSAGVD